MCDHVLGLKGDMKMSMEQHLDMTSKYTVDPEKQSVSRDAVSEFFDVVDTNGNGVISLQEFTVYFKCMGIAEEHAKASFDAIDTDNDGFITRDEFVAAGSEFFNGVDPSHPGTMFLGPLVD